MVCAVKDSYKSKEDSEKGTVLIVGAVSAIVLVSPIIGIQSARKAISMASDEEAKANYKANDPRKGRGFGR